MNCNSVWDGIFMTMMIIFLLLFCALFAIFFATIAVCQYARPNRVLGAPKDAGRIPREATELPTGHTKIVVAQHKDYYRTSGITRKPEKDAAHPPLLNQASSNSCKVLRKEVATMAPSACLWATGASTLGWIKKEAVKVQLSLTWDYNRAANSRFGPEPIQENDYYPKPTECSTKCTEGCTGNIMPSSYPADRILMNPGKPQAFNPKPGYGMQFAVQIVESSLEPQKLFGFLKIPVRRARRVDFCCTLTYTTHQSLSRPPPPLQVDFHTRPPKLNIEVSGEDSYRHQFGDLDKEAGEDDSAGWNHHRSRIYTLGEGWSVEQDEATITLEGPQATHLSFTCNDSTSATLWKDSLESGCEIAKGNVAPPPMPWVPPPPPRRPSHSLKEVSGGGGGGGGGGSATSGGMSSKIAKVCHSCSFGSNESKCACTLCQTSASNRFKCHTTYAFLHASHTADVSLPPPPPSISVCKGSFAKKGGGLCNSCSFGQKHRTCCKCGKKEFESQCKPAKLCNSCSFGSDGRKCVLCRSGYGR